MVRPFSLCLFVSLFVVVVVVVVMKTSVPDIISCDVIAFHDMFHPEQALDL